MEGPSAGPLSSVFAAVNAVVAQTPASLETQQFAAEVCKNQAAELATSGTFGDNGDRGQEPSSRGDREFFLDEFDADGVFTAPINTGVEQHLNRNAHETFYRPVDGIGPTSPTSFDGGVLFPSSGSEDNASVLSKKKPLSRTSPASPDEEKCRVTARFSRASFMRSSRSARQQAAAELGLQMWWGAKFAAGRLHSMIRCSEPDGHVSFLNSEDIQPSSRQRPRGKPCCSEPGCTNQVQMKGKCVRHGGVPQCKHPGCSSAASWHGLCVPHGGRRECSEEGCMKLIRSAGKCEHHGGGGPRKCSHPNCTSNAQKRGLCVGHGGFTECKREGCERRATYQGLCRAHGGAKKCKVGGCEKTVLNRGFCYKHGVENGVIKVSQKPRCKEDGCVKIQLYHGFCSRHAQEHGVHEIRTCKVDGCNRVVQSKGCCGTHGGGTRCKISSCDRPIVTKGLCSAHGGRKTCKVEGCEKWGLSAGNLKGYCIQHGGGTRCKHPGCTKSVQYKGLCCVHGGKLKCEADGCNKSVRVKGYCPHHQTE